MQRVHVVHDFAKPPARVFAHLAEHEHLGPLLGARVLRLADGADGRRNGAGSVRQLKIGPLPAFEETNVEVVEDERIRYRITRGSPLRGHDATMAFAPTPTGGTHLTWDITFGAAVPGLAALVRLALTRSITAGLPAVDRDA